MNILFLSQIVPYPPHGGVLQRGYNIIREISKHNAIHLLAFVHPDVLITEHEMETARHELGKFCSNVEFFDLWAKQSTANKYHALLGSLFSPIPFGTRAHRSIAYRQRVFELTRDGAFDVVHYDTIFLGQFESSNPGLTRVLTHHNIESMLMERRSHFEQNPLARWYLASQANRLKRYEAKESGRYDVNIVMSDADGSALREIAPDADIAVVPNGVDVSYFSPGNEAEVPALIYTGGMNMFANKDAVLYFLKDIWPVIKRRVPDLIFYAVGQDPPQVLSDLAHRDRDIEVPGFVDDIRPLVSSASVYVVPLRVGGGTRLKVLDAMAMGKAIVSTSIGCEGLNVCHEKNILIADTPEDFAAKTIELLHNPIKRKSLGAMARQLIEAEYSWERIGKHLQGIYETTVATKALRTNQ